MNRVLRSSETVADWHGLPFVHMHCADCELGEVENPDYVFTMLVRGRCDTEILYGGSRRRDFHFVTGTFCAYPPGIHWQRLESVGRTELLSLRISDAWLERNGLLRTRRASLGTTLPQFQDHTVQLLGFEILREIEQGCPSGTLFAESIGLALLARVDHLALFSKTGGRVRNLSSSVARRMTEHIQDHLGEALSVRSLAQVAGLGERTFSEAFRGSFGMPVHQYVTQRRLDCAMWLLRENAHTLSEIARRCGYASQSHFASAFRLAIGQTPSQYRAGR